MGLRHESEAGGPHVRPSATPEHFATESMIPRPDRAPADTRAIGPSPVSRTLSVGWALIPLVTIGLGAPFSFAYAAVRLRSKVLAISAAAYAVLAALNLWVGGSTANDNSWQSTFSVTISFVTMAVGTGQAFAVRKRLLDGNRELDPTVAHAKGQIQLRKKALHIVQTDPQLARELRIGRPDLNPRFDDGGLVDVNHVPVAILTRLSGVDEALARHIVDVRDGIGGFASVDDLSVTLGLDPHRLDIDAGRMLFIH